MATGPTKADLEKRVSELTAIIDKVVEKINGEVYYIDDHLREELQDVLKPFSKSYDITVTFRVPWARAEPPTEKEVVDWLKENNEWIFEDICAVDQSRNAEQVGTVTIKPSPPAPLAKAK